VLTTARDGSTRITAAHVTAALLAMNLAATILIDALSYASWLFIVALG
jgi:hypothetical protein